MNPLYLSGYGVKIKVKNMRCRSDLHIANGRDGFGKKLESCSFRPRRMPYDSIIIDGHSGYISLQAFHWLSRNKVPVFILSYDGSLISSVLPPMPVKADLRAAQFEVCKDPVRKLKIAYEIVKAKIQRSRDVLKWLVERYDIEKHIRRVDKEALALSKAKTVNDIRIVEGRVAQHYWLAIQSIVPETFCFQSRIVKSHQYNASDPFNLCLNYAYGVIEGYVRRAINIVGLEPSVGFLHEFTGSQTRESLVYDLQEPFRWLGDVTTIEAFESSALDMKDFYFTGDDYSYKIEIEAKRRFLQLLKDRFNSGVSYKGCVLKWDTVIEQKTTDLTRYLTGRSRLLDLSEPEPELDRTDSLEIRKCILSLSHSEAGRLEIGKSTLHSLRMRAQSNRQFKVYNKVQRRLEKVEVCV